MLTEYVEKILKARVYDVAIETPLEVMPRLSARLGNQILQKREDLQQVFSFKLRGAYNRMSHLTEEERQRGVVAASAGNHAQGVALSAHKMGISAIIVMPKTTPPIKVEAVRALEDGVLMDIREGDVGAILGWGFAPWSGGPFSWLDMLGAARAAELCDRLVKRHGARFAAPDLLRDLAAKDQTFYGRFDTQANAA